MATVTIPVDGSGGNPVRVMINGVEYVIPRGVETTVSDAVAAELAKPDMALIGGSGYPEDTRILPVVDATDNDKVLTVVNGAWEPAAAGSGLPEVSASNNGNVLTVVSGEWAAAAPSGGGAHFITPTESGQTMTITESYNDIKALLDAGTMVYLCINTEIPDVMTGSTVLPLWTAIHDTDGCYVSFVNYSYAQGSDDLVVSTHMFTAATATSPMSTQSGQ